MLEVFGSPDQPEANQSNCSQQPPSGMMMTSPGWQHLGGGVWVYAAYCSSGQVCRHVTAVGVLQDLDSAAESMLQCALWYEESTQHLQGILSVTTDKASVTTFTCESKYPNKSPYAVAIYKGKGNLKTNQLITYVELTFSSIRTTASSSDSTASNYQIFHEHLHSARFSNFWRQHKVSARKFDIPQFCWSDQY